MDKEYIKTILDSAESLVDTYCKLLTPDKIAKELEGYDYKARQIILLAALYNNNLEAVEKMYTANEILKQNQVANFKKSVKEGTTETFLAKLSFFDKVNIRHLIPQNEEKYSDEEIKYLNILASSIEKDKEKIKTKRK